MQRLIGATILASAALAAVTPASAAIIFHFNDPGAIQPDETTQFTNNQTGLTVFAFTNQTNRQVAVQSLDGGTLQTQASGQAFAQATDGTLDRGQIFLPGIDPDFTEIEFLFSGGAQAGDVLTFTATGSQTFTQSFTLPSDVPGNFWFSAQATGPDFFTNISFDVTSADFNQIQQIRIGGFDKVPPIPEPASWGLMLAGFGTVGYAMRRRRRTTVNFA